MHYDSAKGMNKCVQFDERLWSIYDLKVNDGRLYAMVDEEDYMI